MKEILGSSYQDYNLVFASDYGTPMEGARIRRDLNKLIKENDLPPIVFHSMRHASITYKLKLSGGDIKSVQGDSGHAQAKMVEQFYSGKGRLAENKNTAQVPDGIDPAILQALQDPDTAQMLVKLVKSLSAGKEFDD